MLNFRLCFSVHEKYKESMHHVSYLILGCTTMRERYFKTAFCKETV